MLSDYDELPLGLEDLPEGSQAHLWVTFTGDPHASLVLKNVTSAVHYQGWWTIEYDLVPRTRASALLQSSRVRMFSVVYRIADENGSFEECTFTTEGD